MGFGICLFHRPFRRPEPITPALPFGKIVVQAGRDRVKPVTAPGMAAADARNGEPKANPRAVSVNGLQGIFRASGQMATLPTQQGRQGIAIDRDQSLEYKSNGIDFSHGDKTLRDWFKRGRITCGLIRGLRGHGDNLVFCDARQSIQAFAVFYSKTRAHHIITGLVDKVPG